MALNSGGGGGGASARGIEAGKAFVRLGAKDDMSAVLKKAAAGFMNLGKQALALTGVGGLLGGLVGGLSFKETVDDLTKMNDVAKAFGITGKQASGLFGVLGAVGGEFKENLEGVIQFSDTLNQALAGGKISEGARLFDGLAVTAKELEGLAVDEQFYRVHAAIRDLPQPLQEAKLALLGGTDSMKQWQRLLSMSSDEVRAMAGDLAMSTTELEDATKASRAMQAAGAALNRVWQQGAIAIAPLVADLAKMGADALQPAAAWLKGRTLQDLWDELVARGNQAWVEIKIAFGSTFADVWDFFKSGWNSAVYVVKNLFADMIGFVSKAMGDAFEPLWKLWEQVTGTPAPARAVLAGAGAGAAGLRRQAQQEFDAAEADLKDGQKGREATKGRLRGEAQAAVDAIAARVEERRRRQAWDDLMQTTVALGGLAAKASAVGRTAGVLGGGGAFLRQGFGFQGGDTPAKQMVKEQKVTNAKLGDLVKAVTGIGFPKFL